MKKFYILSILPIFFLSCSCIIKVKAQSPQILTNVGQIVWKGSDPSIGPCIWQVVNNVVSTPCGTGGGSYTLPIATNSVLGGIKPDGATITVNPSTGVASASSAASGPPNVYCVSTNASGLIAQTINCNAFSYNAGDFINYNGTTGGNNGITNMLAYCASLSPQTCYATIPPSYTGTDNIPGYGLDFTIPDTVTSAVSSNTILIDERAGSRTYLTNNWCAISFSNQCQESITQSVAWAIQGSNKNVNYFVQRHSEVWQGLSQNYNNIAYQDISNFTPYPNFFTMLGSGQGILQGNLIAKLGPGDGLGFSNSVVCKLGLTGAYTDEGCEKGDSITYVVAVNYQALVSVGGSKPTAITVGNPIQGSGTLAIGGELIDRTSGVVTGTAIAQSCSGDTSLTTPCVITVVGTPFTPDSARGTIGTAIPVGTNSVTPTFTVGSASNFSTSLLACLSDGFETERIFPSSVSGGTITFINAKPHLSTALITTGSSTCGTDFGFDADTIISSTYGNIPNGTSTLPATPPSGASLVKLFKVVGSPANNQLTVAWQGKGSYRQIQDNSSCCLAINGSVVNGAFHLYPSATITTINAGGTASGLNTGLTSGVIGLAPNNVNFTVSDLVDAPIGGGQQVSGGHDIYSPLFASFLTAPGGGLSADYYSIMHGGDSLLALNNHTPTSFYTNGYYSYPYGIKANTSYTTYPLWIPQGSQGSFLMPCSLACNITFYPWAQLGNALAGGAGYENLLYDQVHGWWAFSVNNHTFNYWFKTDGLELPQIADGSVTTPDSGSMKVYYSTTQSCPAYWAFGGSITCFGSGGGGSGNATSIQGNAVATGSFSNSGQSYIWNGSALAITQTNTLQAGWGSAIASPSTGTQQINVVRPIRVTNAATDTITTADCGGTIIEQFAGTTAIGIPQANSGSGLIMPTTCFVDIISWTGNTSNLSTTTSTFYSILGSNSGTFSVAGAKKELTSLGGNYYQTQ